MQGDARQLDRGFVYWGNQRIYFPPIGPARLVRSLEEEDRFNRSLFRATFILFLMTVIGSTVLTLLWERSVSGEGLILLLVTRSLSKIYFARHWPAIPANEYSYAHYVAARNAQRGFATLSMLLLLWLVMFAGAAVLLILYVTNPPFFWSELSLTEKLFRSILPIALATGLGSLSVSIYRCVIGLSAKFQRSSV